MLFLAMTPACSLIITALLNLASTSVSHIFMLCFISFIAVTTDLHFTLVLENLHKYSSPFLRLVLNNVTKRSTALFSGHLHTSGPAAFVLFICFIAALTSSLLILCNNQFTNFPLPSSLSFSTLSSLKYSLSLLHLLCFGGSNLSLLFIRLYPTFQWRLLFQGKRRLWERLPTKPHRYSMRIVHLAFINARSLINKAFLVN